MGAVARFSEARIGRALPDQSVLDLMAFAATVVTRE